MTTIVTRAGKGSPLTHAEVDANFTGLNSGKVEATLAGVVAALGYTPLNKAGDTPTGVINFTTANLNLQDPTDTTKQAVFSISANTTGTTRTYTLPNSSGTIPLLGLAQTFSAAQTFSSTITASSTITLSGSTSGATSLGTSATTGTLTAGGTAQTGTITLGRSTASQQTDIQAGATASGSTKTMNFGTGGLTGSTTLITMGSVFGTSLIRYGANYTQQTTPTSKAAAATLTAAEILVGITQYTGAAASLTMPLATALDSGLPSTLAADGAFDFSVINTGSGTATIATNTGITLVGAMTVAAGASGMFRLRKTATSAYTVYRLA